jgi:Flp pilus assembly protein TadB
VRAVLPATAALIALAATGWVVGALAAATAAAVLPGAVAAGRERRAQRIRAEALAVWAEMLRDAVVSGRGLAEALAATAPLAPLPLRDAALTLRARAMRGQLAPALRSFAEEVDDPLADLLAATLTLAATREVRDLADLLGALASGARQQARLRLTVDASRAGLRTTARAVGAIAAATLGGLLAFRPTYFEPYDTARGQLVLAFGFGWFALGAWGLARLGQPPRPRRLRLRAAEEVPT